MSERLYKFLDIHFPNIFNIEQIETFRKSFFNKRIDGDLPNKITYKIFREEFRLFLKTELGYQDGITQRVDNGEISPTDIVGGQIIGAIHAINDSFFYLDDFLDFKDWLN